MSDNANMGEHTEPGRSSTGPGPTRLTGHQRRREDLTPHQLRTIGQRRADAEEKLARHLREAQHLPGKRPAAAEKPTGD